MTLLCCLVAANGCRTAVPPELDPVWIEEGTTVRRLSCYSNEPFGSRYGRSEPLSSADGQMVAWSEVRAIASQPGDETSRSCRNVSRLWIQRAGGDAHLAFEQNPGAEGKNGNSIVPVAWSPDGRQLLFELDTWTYYTDREPPMFALWPADGGEIERIPIEPAMREEFGAECGFQVIARGFDRDGSVIIETSPLPPTARGLPACHEETRQWRVGDDGRLIGLAVR